MANTTLKIASSGGSLTITQTGTHVDLETLPNVAADTSVTISGGNTQVFKVNLATNGGLATSSGVKILLADTSLALGSGGVQANLATNSGLQVSSGLLLKLNGTSLALSSSGVAVNLATNPGLVISSGLKIQLADSTLALGASGVQVALIGSNQSGLIVASGLGVQLLSTGGLRIDASNNVYNNGLNQLSADPGSVFEAGDQWFNTTIKLPRVAVTTAMFGSGHVTIFGGANGTTITNSTTLTAMTPNVTMSAGFLNQIGRILRITCVIGGSGVSGTFTLTLFYGTTAIWSAVLTGTTFSNMQIEIMLYTAGTGASGTLLAIGKYFNASVAYTSVDAATTVDLTSGGLFGFKGQWSAASGSNSAQMSGIVCEVVN